MEETTKRSGAMYRVVHPGELLQEFITGGVTVTSLAAHLDYPRGNLSKVLNGRLGIGPALAVKLGQAFPNQDAEFWMRLQVQYELALERKKKTKKIKALALATA